MIRLRHDNQKKKIIFEKKEPKNIPQYETARENRPVEKGTTWYSNWMTRRKDTTEYQVKRASNAKIVTRNIVAQREPENIRA